MATKNDITRLSGSGLNQGFESVELQQAQYMGDMASGVGFTGTSGGGNSYSLGGALGVAGQVVGLATGIDQLFSGGYRQREAQRQQLKNQMIVNQQSQDFAIEQMIKSGQINLLNSIAINDRYNTVEAKRKQYIAAGMNPALAMGLGAGGSGGSANVGSTGTAGAHGGQAQGLDPSSVGRNNVEAAMMLSQLELNKSLANKADQDAEKTKVDTDKTKGVDTEKVKVEIGLMSEQSQSEAVKRVGYAIENAISEIERQMGEASKEDRINIIKEEYSQAVRQSAIAMEDLAQKRRNNEIGNKTMEAEIAKIWGEQKAVYTQIALWGAQTEAEKKGIELKDADIENIKKRTENIDRELEIKQDFNNTLKAGAKWQFAGKFVEGAFDIGAAYVRGGIPATSTQTVHRMPMPGGGYTQRTLTNTNSKWHKPLFKQK